MQYRHLQTTFEHESPKASVSTQAVLQRLQISFELVAWTSCNVTKLILTTPLRDLWLTAMRR